MASNEREGNTHLLPDDAVLLLQILRDDEEDEIEWHADPLGTNKKFKDFSKLIVIPKEDLKPSSQQVMAQMFEVKERDTNCCNYILCIYEQVKESMSAKLLAVCLSIFKNAYILGTEEDIDSVQEISSIIDSSIECYALDSESYHAILHSQGPLPTAKNPRRVYCNQPNFRGLFDIISSDIQFQQIYAHVQLNLCSHLLLFRKDELKNQIKQQPLTELQFRVKWKKINCFHLQFVLCKCKVQKNRILAEQFAECNREGVEGNIRVIEKFQKEMNELCEYNSLLTNIQYLINKQSKCSHLILKEFKFFEKKKDQYENYEDFEEDIDLFYSFYMDNCPNFVNKKLIILEFLTKVLKDGAKQFIIKSTQHSPTSTPDPLFSFNEKENFYENLMQQAQDQIQQLRKEIVASRLNYENNLDEVKEKRDREIKELRDYINILEISKKDDTEQNALKQVTRMSSEQKNKLFKTIQSELKKQLKSQVNPDITNKVSEFEIIPLIKSSSNKEIQQSGFEEESNEAEKDLFLRNVSDDPEIYMYPLKSEIINSEAQKEGYNSEKLLNPLFVNENKQIIQGIHSHSSKNIPQSSYRNVSEPPIGNYNSKFQRISSQNSTDRSHECQLDSKNNQKNMKNTMIKSNTSYFDQESTPHQLNTHNFKFEQLNIQEEKPQCGQNIENMKFRSQNIENSNSQNLQTLPFNQRQRAQFIQSPSSIPQFTQPLQPFTEITTYENNNQINCNHRSISSTNMDSQKFNSFSHPITQPNTLRDETPQPSHFEKLLINKGIIYQNVSDQFTYQFCKEKRREKQCVSLAPHEFRNLEGIMQGKNVQNFSGHTSNGKIDISFLLKQKIEALNNPSDQINRQDISTLFKDKQNKAKGDTNVPNQVKCTNPFMSQQNLFQQIYLSSQSSKADFHIHSNNNHNITSNFNSCRQKTPLNEQKNAFLLPKQSHKEDKQSIMQPKKIDGLNGIHFPLNGKMSSKFYISKLQNSLNKTISPSAKTNSQTHSFLKSVITENPSFKKLNDASFISSQFYNKL